MTNAAVIQAAQIQLWEEFSKEICLNRNMYEFAFDTVMTRRLQKGQRLSLEVPNNLRGLEVSQNHSFLPYFW